VASSKVGSMLALQLLPELVDQPGVAQGTMALR
jgi:hypothetical protein